MNRQRPAPAFSRPSTLSPALIPRFLNQPWFISRAYFTGRVAMCEFWVCGSMSAMLMMAPFFWAIMCLAQAWLIMKAPRSPMFIVVSQASTGSSSSLPGTIFIVVAAVIHMLRVVALGSYKKPREVTWMTGVILLLIQAGGFGIMAGSTLLLMLFLGRRTTLRNRIVIQESLGYINVVAYLSQQQLHQRIDPRRIDGTETVRELIEERGLYA